MTQSGGLHSPPGGGGPDPPSGCPSTHAVLLPAVPIAEKITNIHYLNLNTELSHNRVKSEYDMVLK